MNAFALRRHQRLLRFVILLITALQVGPALAPHSGSVSAATAGQPHWHASGDTLELGHDETACPVCNVQHTVRETSQPARSVFFAVHGFRLPARTNDRPADAVGFACVLPRAPPSIG